MHFQSSQWINAQSSRKVWEKSWVKQFLGEVKLNELKHPVSLETRLSRKSEKFSKIYAISKLGTYFSFTYVHVLVARVAIKLNLEGREFVAGEGFAAVAEKGDRETVQTTFTTFQNNLLSCRGQLKRIESARNYFIIVAGFLPCIATLFACFSDRDGNTMVNMVLALRVESGVGVMIL
ncbi:hypothetical protein Trydic_g6430 [Trypoxylus dichotomus]